MMKRTTMLLFLVTLLISSTQLVTAYAQRRNRFPFDFKPRFNETDPRIMEKFEDAIEFFITGRIIVSSLNSILYGYLTYFYVMLYRGNKSKFTLGLSALSIVLFIYAISSNPVVLQFFRVSTPIWFSVFNIVPDVFATIAALIMIYLSKT